MIFSPGATTGGGLPISADVKSVGLPVQCLNRSVWGTSRHHGVVPRGDGRREREGTEEPNSVFSRGPPARTPDVAAEWFMILGDRGLSSEPNTEAVPRPLWPRSDRPS